MTTDRTLAEVRQVVVETLGLDGTAAALEADSPLLGSIPELDSMAVLALLTSLEDRFGIVVEDEEFSGELLDTLGGLSAFVHGKRA